MSVQTYLPNFEPEGAKLEEYTNALADSYTNGEPRLYTPLASLAGLILTETAKAPTGTPFPDFSELDEVRSGYYRVEQACDLENPEPCEACQ